MPLIPLLAAPELIILAVGLFVLLRMLTKWQRPTLAPTFAAVDAKHKPATFWQRVKTVFTTAAFLLPNLLAKTPAKGLLLKAWRHVEGWTTGLLANALGGMLHGATSYVNGLSQLAWRVPAGTAALAEATYNALNTLTHRTVPNLIHNALVPVVKNLATVTTLANRTATWLAAGTGAIASDLTSIGWRTAAQPDRALANFGDAFVNLWRYTRGQLTQRVDTITNVTVPALRRDITAVADDLWDVTTGVIPGLRTRVKSLEDQLRDLAASLGAALGEIPSAATIAAAAVAAVAAAAPWLFCRNTRGVAQKLCGLPEDELAGLLAGTLALAVVLDPRLLAAIAGEVTEDIEGLIRATADV